MLGASSYEPADPLRVPFLRGGRASRPTRGATGKAEPPGQRDLESMGGLAITTSRRLTPINHRTGNLRVVVLGGAAFAVGLPPVWPGGLRVDGIGHEYLELPSVYKARALWPHVHQI